MFRRKYIHPEIAIGFVLLLLLASFAFLFPYLSNYTYEQTALSSKNLTPSFTHIFGTDDLGRDQAVRIAHGLQVSLLIGLLAAFLDLIIGVSIGSLSGYFGGLVDSILMSITELFYSIPFLLAVLLVVTLLGPGVYSILLAMCFFGWIQMARMSRIEVMRVKNSDAILAAHAIGIHPSRIFLFHIFPLISGSLITLLMQTIPHAIFIETFLSFLGIGIQPPLASLGSLVSDGLPAMRFYPHRLFYPSMVLSITIFAFQLISDGCRDLFDQKRLKSVEESSGI